MCFSSAERIRGGNANEKSSGNSAGTAAHLTLHRAKERSNGGIRDRQGSRRNQSDSITLFVKPVKYKCVLIRDSLNSSDFLVIVRVCR